MVADPSVVAHTVSVELLRSRDWLEDHGAYVGGKTDQYHVYCSFRILEKCMFLLNFPQLGWPGLDQAQRRKPRNQHVLAANDSQRRIPWFHSCLAPTTATQTWSSISLQSCVNGPNSLQGLPLGTTLIMIGICVDHSKCRLFPTATVDADFSWICRLPLGLLSGLMRQ